MERSTSLTSDDLLLQSFYKVQSNISLPRIDSDSQFHDFLKKIPSSSNLASGGILDGSGEPSPAGAGPGGVPRVPSLDLIRAFLNVSRPMTGDAAAAAPLSPGGVGARRDAPLSPPGYGDATAAAAAAAGALPLQAFTGAGALQLSALQSAALQNAAAAAGGTNAAALAAALMGQGQLPAAFLGASQHGAVPGVGSVPTSVPTSALNGSEGTAGASSDGGGGGAAGAPGDAKQQQRRERRMLSNRESARRSRKRKQEHLQTLESALAEVEASKAALAAQSAAMAEEAARRDAELAALRAENDALRAVLGASGGAGSAAAGAGAHAAFLSKLMGSDPGAEPAPASRAVAGNSDDTNNGGHSSD